LSVRAVDDADGQETGMFEAPAGGRRCRALELLVKQKRIAKTQPVPCVIRDGGIAEDDSLAENDGRVGLHPLDQFRAFKLLRGGGMRGRYRRAALRLAGDRQAAPASGISVAEVTRRLCPTMA
jgi:ParB family chromosome partitioning protein